MINKTISLSMSILLQVNNIYKNFSNKVLFQNVSFTIATNDKIALVGINGAGKTTLIKILLGLEEPDTNPITHSTGNITKYSDYTAGYLSQNNNLNPENTVFEELIDIYSLKNIFQKIQIYNLKMTNDNILSEHNLEEYSYLISEFERQNGYKIEQTIITTLKGLNIDQNIWYKQIKFLSGGQKTLIGLTKLLLIQPDLLILDEPTNHLDLNAIFWLEEFLYTYEKAVFIISHDTYFLDKVVNRVLELENKLITSYKGNYTDYKIQKEIYLSGALKAFKKEEERREKLKEFILKYKAGQKAKQARGRQKLLDKMEQSNNPIIPVRKIKLKFAIETPSSNDILKIVNLSKVFENKLIFNNINLEINKGDKIGLIGKNGIGKSTILKIINNLDTPTSGKIILGKQLQIGYYDQTHQNLNNNNTILEEISREFNLSEEKARLIAGGFLFSNEEVLKKISSLSGGEKARVSLIKLILSKPNFIIMDEPTNHLDIYAKEILTEALENYQGTLLLVSHDRSFLNLVTNKIYLIEKNSATQFDGNYDQYIKSLQNMANIRIINKKMNHNSENQLSSTVNENVEITNLHSKIKNLQEELKKLNHKENYFYEQVTKTNNENKINEFQDKLLDLEIKKLHLDTQINNLSYELKNIEKNL